IRALQGVAGKPDGGDPGPPIATGAHRVCLRSIFRRCRGFWYTRGGDRGHPDRHGLSAPASFRTFTDREHRARGVWSDRHAASGTGGSHTTEFVAAERHGRPDSAVFLAAGAVLADLGVLRIPGNGRDLAGDAGRRIVFCHSAIPDLELPRALACGRDRFGLLDGGADRTAVRLASEA